MSTTKKLKIAVFHAFLKNKGGAEKVVLDVCLHYKADLFVGSIVTNDFNKDKEDSFSKDIFYRIPSFVSLHEESIVPIWRLIKRQLFFLFSPKITLLKDYDIVIFSGNIFWFPLRLRRKFPNINIITYCHTPPRPFTDFKERVLASLPFFVRPFYILFSAIVVRYFKQGLLESDVVISNSINIQNRLSKYLQIKSTPIFPPINTDKFKYITAGDYYISYARLEDVKRVELIIQAFTLERGKKLIICSTGPLKDWIQEQIKTHSLINVEFKGLVSDEELSELVGSCKAGIFIPIDEDAGITQCEIMAAGKPVLGVAEGGLLETVIHKKTGYLIPADPSVEDLIDGLNWIDSHDLTKLRAACEERAKEFDKSIFFDKLDKIMSSLTDTAK